MEWFYRDCEELTDENRELVSCMEEFYHKVYQNEVNCTKDFDFLSKHLSAKSEAFKSGESCFLDIVEENCMDSSIHYLNHNYAQFLEVLTVLPKNQNCISLHDYLMGAQCIPLKSELVGIGRKMKLTGKLGDSVEDLRNKCREARECMIGSRHLLESLGEVENMCAEI
ncbi:hypothetical protein CAEBREN_06481 [Caenorhabditis brenneri]|uniref:T20D4.11-like domain-containing protein n=1 Tax=Caenorhabditis brenneri TaxID=135651 RepID=G0M9X7_CAEBE|nr:hypothetical protein CAEBREN_06481 [Caenorhabditis brenneri]